VGDSKEISIGERLSSARKKKRLRYKKLSSELNIEESYLIALEEENFHLIPGGEAYVKGFLRSYSKKLNLDPDEIITQYRELNYELRKNRIRTSSNDNLKPSFDNLKILLVILFLGIILSSIFFFQAETPQSKENISAEETSIVRNQSVTMESEGNSAYQDPVNQFSVSLNTNTDNTAPDMKGERLSLSAPKTSLSIEVFDDCWLEVFSKTERLLYKLAKSGDQYDFSANQLKLIVGNYKNVQVSFNDKIIDLKMYANVNQVSCVVLPLGDCSEFRTEDN
tara:strand:- start:559 stop:1398 length:840 start_codon:yes stop_codon:yes gene_type:complete